jgi:succinate dehydrogenase/fumarate reductase flavoprotein subunit
VPSPGEDEYDVVVLGTGAAGLVTALAAAELGASVGLFEKAAVVGGTTAVSGGGCWVPGNDRMAEVGATDSRSDALAYLDSLSFGLIRPEFAAAFVDDAPSTFRWLEDVTPLRMRVVAGYPDYHPERPGGRPGGGRTLEPELFSYRLLEEWSDRVVAGHRNPHLMLSDTTLGGGTGVLDADVVAHRAAEDLRGCGAALVGPLLRALLDRGVVPVCGVRAVELLVSDGRVTGVRLDGEAGPREVRARNGVVLATGGFEWDAGLVRDFLRGPMTSPASLPTNEGDGLRMAMDLGAGLSNMAHAWWAPVVEIPGDEVLGRQHATLLNRERTLPRSIMVNRRGRRFTNEASNYNALGGAFHQLDAVEFDFVNLPCWLVFDRTYLDRYGFRSVAPGGTPPSWIVSAPTVADLAVALGLPADALVATVERWNDSVAAGDDGDFARGRSAYDVWSGDSAARGRPESTLGPIDAPPYFAVQVRSGTLGTSGGATTDVDGRVLDAHGEPIGGLFAAGNVMAAPTAMAYGGAGGTLGPIITFARRAGTAASRDVPRADR